MSVVECKSTTKRHVASDADRPLIKLTARKKFEVSSTPIGDAPSEQNRPVLARLCGGVTTCIATIEV